MDPLFGNLPAKVASVDHINRADRAFMDIGPARYRSAKEAQSILPFVQGEAPELLGRFAWLTSTRLISSTEIDTGSSAGILNPSAPGPRLSALERRPWR
jgi:hypothetical protein